MEKILNRLKNFCSLATPLRMRWDSLRMHWDCAETALRLRSLRGDSENWKMFDSRWSRSQSRQSESSIELFNVQLRTCGNGLRKLKFGCVVAKCRFKIKLAVPSTAEIRVLKYACSVNGNMKQSSRVKILYTYTYFFTLMLKYAFSIKSSL